MLCITSFAYAQYPIGGLTAAYEFNGNLNDLANGNNMSIVNGSMLYPTNRVNTPASSLNLLFGDAKCPNIDYQNAGVYRDLMTYSFWVKTSLDDANRRVIIEQSDRSSDSDTEYNGTVIYLKDGKVGINNTLRLGNSDYRIMNKEMPDVISDGNWHHIYISVKWKEYLNDTRVDHLITIAIDGNTLSTSTETYGKPSHVSVASYDVINADIAIGNNSAGNLPASNRFPNQIDDLLMYGIELSAADIQTITNSLNFCFVPNSDLISFANIQNTSVEVLINGSDTYDVAYAPEGTPINQATIVNNVTSMTTLTGLDANVNYEVYIRKLCANTTSWSAPKLFRTTRTTGVLYVNENATGINSGTSWSNAYTNLQSALADAIDGEEIWMTGGTYKPSISGDRFDTFSVNNFVSIYGGFAGNEAAKEDRVYGTNETILSGDLNGDDDAIITTENTLRSDNSYHVISIGALTTTTGEKVVFDRLTISGGNANTVISDIHRTGAAILKDDVVRGLEITDCVIKNNSCRFGIISSSFGTGSAAHLTIKRCIIDNNYSGTGTIYALSSSNFSSVAFSVSIENTQITNNIATDTNVSIGTAGSALFVRAGNVSSATVRIENCTIANNQDVGTFNGYNNFNRTPIIAQRTTTSSAASNTTVRVYNSIFYGNTTANGLTSRAISKGNESTPEPLVEIFNAIDENNFSNIPVANVTNGSSANPVFTNAANGDYTLQINSPAIDAGDNSAVNSTIDLNGNTRIINSVVDLGPYEYFTSLVVAPQVYLQAPMLGVGGTNMNDLLRTGNYLPTTSPYADGATCDPAVFSTTGNDAIVDWIWVELRDAAMNTTVIDSQSALLQRDGNVVATDGVSNLVFNQAQGSYYIVLKHRNHLGIMTNTALNLSQTVTNVDFTDANNQITFGTNAQTTSGMPVGLVAMWSGNANGDTIVQYSGTTPDAPSILSQVLNDGGNFLNFPTYIVTGYNAYDINMDGSIQYAGITPDTPSILQNVLAHPGNFLNFSTYQIQEQLPEN